MTKISNINTIGQPFSSLYDSFFFIKQKLEFIKIFKNEILYVKANGNTTEIHLKSKKYILSTNLSTALKKIHSDCIVKVNRSYAVNITTIYSFSNDQINIMKNNQKIEIALTKKYKPDFLRKINIITTN